MYQWAGPLSFPLPSLIKFRQLLHLNQASVQHLICNLTDAKGSTLLHGEEILGMKWLDLKKDDQRTLDTYMDTKALS